MSETARVRRPAVRARPVGRVAALSPRAVRWASVVTGIAAWELYGRALHSPIFTTPSAVAAAGVALVRSGELQFYLASSLVVFTLGLLLSVVVGIPFGVLMGRRPTVEHAADPYINAFYAMPMVALIPVIVMWLGFQTKAKVIIVFLFCVFPVLINTYQGVKSTDALLLEVARSFCSSERRLWRDVILPSAAPFILAGIRLAIGRGLVGMVVAEFYTTITGLGYMIVQYANTFKMDRLFVPIVVLMIMGVGLTGLLRHLERRVAPWLYGSREE